jgi:cellulose synthase/poly-beta-1,6-N-acetylglucosamine synthase-like glycosyltransferase
VRDLGALAYARPDGGPAYEVVVVDDASTDATAERAAAAAAGADHVSIVRRESDSGPGTKGGVLRHATPFLRGPMIGVVDADSRLDHAFLERVMRAWRRDPTAAALQVARTPRNADRSWLTRAQAEEQLMDLTSQCGRWAAEGTAELRGNGMFVRADILESVGGWAAEAATEDLDLSTRLSVAGHHVGLAPEVEVGEEAVETPGPLWRQRLRWAEGSIRRLIAHGPALLASSAPLRRKVDFVAFSVEFLLPPLFVAAIVASLITIPLPQPADWTVPASLFVGYGLGVFLLALGGLHATGVRGVGLVGRAARGALFLSHWLLVVPAALLRIVLGPATTEFVPTPRFTRSEGP